MVPTPNSQQRRDPRRVPCSQTHTHSIKKERRVTSQKDKENSGQRKRNFILVSERRALHPLPPPAARERYRPRPALARGHATVSTGVG